MKENDEYSSQSIRVNTIKKDVEYNKDYYMLAIADTHIGNTGFNKKLFKKDMDRALSLNADVFIIGDLVDAIVFTDVKRYVPSVNDSEANRDDQVNKWIEDTVNLLAPYAKNIKMISMGNHEYTILKRHGIDIIKLIIKELNNEHGGNIIYGGFLGYMQYLFTLQQPNSTAKKKMDILYYHGKGGDAPVTKGMIDFSRKKLNFVFDLYLTGHKHTLITDTDKVVYLSVNGNVVEKQTRCIECGTYMGLDSNKGIGYAEVGGYSPKDLGGVFIRYNIDYNKEITMRAEV